MNGLQIFILFLKAVYCLLCWSNECHSYKIYFWTVISIYRERLGSLFSACRRGLRLRQRRWPFSSTMLKWTNRLHAGEQTLRFQYSCTKSKYPQSFDELQKFYIKLHQQMHSLFYFDITKHTNCRLAQHVSIPSWDHHHGLLVTV
jgi:hypothetical protein